MQTPKIPTLIGILFLVAGLIAGIFLIHSRQIFRLGAAPTSAPSEIRVSNISDTTVSINWFTDSATIGVIKWGKDQNNLDQVESEDENSPSYTHILQLSNLIPGSDYFFKLSINGYDFDNNGSAWKVSTGPTLSSLPEANLITGTINNKDGTPASGALVFLDIAGAATLSTKAGEDGSWTSLISSARTLDLANYAPVNDATSLISISVFSQEGVASASIYPQSARPVPAITIGQSYNLTNLPASDGSSVPQADPNLPESTPSSSFDVPEGTATPSSDVTLTSIKEGEVVSSTTPEFFGSGPAGSTVTITLESDPITAKTTIDQSGNWSWSPSIELEEGTHKITIKWKGANGTTNTIVKNFIVQASDLPSYESSGSATLKPSPTPTATPTPSPVGSSTPGPTSSATAAPIPETGSLTPTILISIMGIGLVTLGLIFAF